MTGTAITYRDHALSVSFPEIDPRDLALHGLNMVDAARCLTLAVNHLVEQNNRMDGGLDADIQSALAGIEFLTAMSIAMLPKAAVVAEAQARGA